MRTMMSVSIQINEVDYVKIQNLLGKVKPNNAEVKKAFLQLLDDATTSKYVR